MSGPLDNITQDNITYRLAETGDEASIFSLSKEFSSLGQILPLSLSFIEENLVNFTLVLDQGFDEINEPKAELNRKPVGKLVGLCLLYFYDETLAEVRCLGVKKEWQGKGIGSNLIKKSLALAKKKSQELRHRIKLFTLTQKVNLFTRSGFEQVDKASLPEKIYQDCLGCPSYPNCSEKSLVCYVDYSVGLEDDMEE